MKHTTITDLMASASADTRRANPGLALPTRLDSRMTDDSAKPVSAPAETPKRGTGQKAAPFGRCPHTSRAYRSKTEARWAMEHPEHRYEALSIATPCGVYWPDFASVRFSEPLEPSDPLMLWEIKGDFIRDRAMHKVKAAIRPARALGFAGIWLAQWDGKAWTVTEVQEG